MRTVFEKAVEKIASHILCPVTFFPPENRTVYEIMGENVVDPDRPQETIYCGACALRAG